MEFQLNMTHMAANEAGLLTFLTFIKDNYPTVVHDANADSESLKCNVTLIFTTLNDGVAAVVAFKQNFTIKYRLSIA